MKKNLGKKKKRQRRSRERIRRKTMRTLS